MQNRSFQIIDDLNLRHLSAKDINLPDS